jgi:hypothetical protein
MVETLFLFGTIFLLAAIITRLVFCRERRAVYVEPKPEMLSWKHGSIR